MTQAMPSPDTDARPRRRIWLRVLLFVSLAINLAVAGLVGGAVLNATRDGDARPARISRELGLGPYIFAMEADDRRALQEASRLRKGDLRQSRTNWQQAFHDSLEVLRAEPFDPDRFRELVVLQSDLAAEGRKIGQEILVVQVSRMSHDARARFADKLEQSAKFGRRAPDPRGPGHVGPEGHDGNRPPGGPKGN